MRRLTRNADTRSLFPSPFDTLILTHFPNTVNRISKKICDFFIIFCPFFGQFDQLTLTYNKARLFSQPLFDGFCRQGGNLFLKSETFTYILVQKSLFLCDFLLICKSMQKCGRNTFLPHKNVKFYHYCKALGFAPQLCGAKPPCRTFYAFPCGFSGIKKRRQRHRFTIHPKVLIFPAFPPYPRSR